jgi:nanoRNase/pAp phosphatase (c-di-AMP/oligoRNAs hydrolase)
MIRPPKQHIWRFADNTPYWDQLIQEASEHLSSLPGGDVAILAGADPDGYVAANFVKFAVAALFPEKKVSLKTFATFEYLFEDAPEFVEKSQASSVVCVDVPIIQEESVLKEISARASMMICDHHMVPANAPSIPNVKYLNPRLGKTAPIRLPSSLFLYELLAETSRVSPGDCIPLASGLLGDGALHQFPDLIRTVEELLDQRPINEDLLGSRVGFLTRGILAWFQYYPRRSPDFWLDDFHQTNRVDWDDLVERFARSNDLKRIIETLEEAIRREVDGALKAASADDASPILVHRLSSLHFVSNIVANQIARHVSKKIVLVQFSFGDQMQTEIRLTRDLKANIVDIFNEQRTNFKPLSAGGHPTAAGAIVKREDNERFLMTFREAAHQQLSELR